MMQPLKLPLGTPLERAVASLKDRSDQADTRAFELGRESARAVLLVDAATREAEELHAQYASVCALLENLSIPLTSREEAQDDIDMRKFLKNRNPS